MFTFPVHWLFKHMVFLEKTLFVYHVPKITVRKKSDTQFLMCRLTRTPQWKQPVNQQTNPRNRRRWRGKFGANNPRGVGPTEDLRISVPNNLNQVR